MTNDKDIKGPVGKKWLVNHETEPLPVRPESSAGWVELHEATADLMASFTAVGPKFDRVRDALMVKPNAKNQL